MTKDEAMKLALEAFEQWMQIDTLEDAHTFEMITAPEAMAALRQALEQLEQEPVAWRNAAIRLGEDLYSVGPNGYYNMTASQWLDWALSVVNTAPPKPAQDLIVGYADSHDLNRDGHDFWVSREPGKNTVPLYLYGHPPKIWQGLTDEEMLYLISYQPQPLANRTAIINAVERILKKKNGF